MKCTVRRGGRQWGDLHGECSMSRELSDGIECLLGQVASKIGMISVEDGEMKSEAMTDGGLEEDWSGAASNAAG